MQQHICYNGYAIASQSDRSSGRLVVCPSHGWISQKRLKLRWWNFHHRVASWLQFSHGELRREILKGI